MQAADPPDRSRERRRMVERQLRGRGIEDELVLEAMAEVARERFVGPDEQQRAYEDGALRVGEGQTISQPWIVASMAALLELEGPESVLEVGTGSGYAAAVLSRLCSFVVTIERHPSLAERAAATLDELGYRNVEVHTGDGSLGVPQRAPFDAISVTATASERPPAALVEQLVAGGALVCPVASAEGERLMRFRDGAAEAIAPVRFVPLVVGDGPARE